MFPGSGLFRVLFLAEGQLIGAHQLFAVVKAGAGDAGVEKQALFAQVQRQTLAANGGADAGFGQIQLHALANLYSLAETHVLTSRRIEIFVSIIADHGKMINS